MQQHPSLDGPDHGDNTPVSVPAVLTKAQQERVCCALERYAKRRTIDELSALLDVAKLYIEAVRKGKIGPSVIFAAKLAKVMDVRLEDLIGLVAG